MKYLKEMWLSVLPTIVTCIVAVVMFIFVHSDLVNAEMDECWERLESEVISASEEISFRLHDNLSMLELMADVIQIHGEEMDEKSMRDYLATTRENTIFCKMSIAFPDGSIFYEDGTILSSEGKDPSYEELAVNKTIVTKRVMDTVMETEVVYCTTPIINQEEEIIGVLIGTIDCVNLSDYFRSSLYNGNGSVFIIDRQDGKFIMDNWHDGFLATMEEVSGRESVIKYSEKPVSQMILDGESGRTADVSRTTGNVMYSSFAPIPDTNWTILVTISEDYILSTVNQLENTLGILAMIGSVIIIVIVISNILMAISAAKERMRVQAFEYEKASNEAKNRFLATMSHDIRTPLNGIIGMVDIIEKHNEDEKRVKDCVGKIKISANYLMNLTNDILDLNAIEDGKFRLTDDPIELCSFVEELGIIVAQRAAEQGVTCNIDCSNIEHARVFGSTIHLRRIMINIVSNAIKYNKKNGSIWITLDETEKKDGFGQYRLTVRDNGIGMSEEFQKNMFNSFEQEAVSARTSDQGHGLGLSIVKRLTEKMNGTIEVESKKGIGTTFIVTIPLRIDTENDTVDNMKVRAENSDITGIHILMAEDNEFNMEIATVLLTDAGAIITPVENGKLALETFAAAAPNTFDVILMDIMMPEMDGLTAAKEIRALDRADAKTIPIIAMTANAFQTDIEACKEAGMNEHVAKPLDMKVMAQKISQYTKI